MAQTLISPIATIPTAEISASTGEIQNIMPIAITQMIQSERSPLSSSILQHPALPGDKRLKTSPARVFKNAADYSAGGKTDIALKQDKAANKSLANHPDAQRQQRGYNKGEDEP